jgi:hypothetical protein
MGSSTKGECGAGKKQRTSRCSGREPAVPLRDQSDIIGGWLPSLTFAFDSMSVAHVIRKAERILPGKEAVEGELDARWQAIIRVADHIEEHPEEVWRFTRKWGAHANEDLRMAVATCLLEHLLEHHFDRMFPLVSAACRESKRFAWSLSMCSEFGQTTQRGNMQRFRRLKQQVGAPPANQSRQPTPGGRPSVSSVSAARRGCARRGMKASHA